MLASDRDEVRRPPSGDRWSLRAPALSLFTCAQHKAPKKQKVAKEDKEPNAKKTKKADEDEKGEPKEKRPPSAYFIFSDEKRKEVRAVLTGARQAHRARQAHPHARAWTCAAARELARRARSVATCPRAIGW
jgi:hypothetical protein